jgi:hypothetical protein
VLLVGVLAFAGGASLSYQFGAELLNFGAFIAFMGVNLAAFVRYWVRSDDRRLMNAVLPLTGFLVCLYLWLSLRWPARVAGGAWLAAGVIYGAIRTRGFRDRIVSFDIGFDEKESR